MAIPAAYNYTEMQHTNAWRYIYAAPIPTSLYALIMLITLHKYDSLAFLIRSTDITESMELIDRMYPKETIRQRERLRRSLESSLCTTRRTVSFSDSILKKDYMNATMMCVALALFN